ncbi:MAG: flagellar filament capping protein FliD [Armatimonadetes bacterium]|nr:flagellar filament capping protein FliD [Armatimonadota bacterium]
MSVSGISFTGIGSGIDSATIISQLMQIESIPIQRMQSQQASFTGKLDLYGQLGSKIAAISAAASAMNNAASMSPLTASVSDSSVASVSIGSGAAQGAYHLVVNQLAKAHKVISGPQSASDTALNLSGDIVVNGKVVTIATDDTLSTIAGKINGLGSGVTASVIGGSGSSYLSLTSDKTGTVNTIQAADVSGTVLSSLGLTGTNKAYREAVTGGFRTYRFSSDTSTVASLTGSSRAGSFSINGQSVSVDFASDSLSTIASKINAANANVTATVVSTTVDGKTVKQLEVKGTLSAMPTDPDGILAALGVFQSTYSSPVTAAQDAAYEIDGIAKTSSSNTVSDVVAGLTFTLLKDGDAETDIVVGRDPSKVKSLMKSYQEAFNGLVDFVKTYSSFDSDTYSSGPLFGDLIATRSVSAVQDSVFKVIGSGDVQSLADLGFGLDTDGKLTFDESRFDTVLSSDPEGVTKLMVSSGSTDTAQLAFVSSSYRTKDPGAAGFKVEVTRLATLSTTTASVAGTQANRGGEKLTFAGKAFSAQVEIDVATGASLADVASQINSNASLSNVMKATVDGNGKLVLTALRYGSATDFTVASNLDAAADTTGIGTEGGVRQEGFDIEGKINDEAAVGTGQYLIGKETNATSADLQVKYTGTTLGIIGTVDYSRGLSSYMMEAVGTVNDPANGMLTATTKTIQSQIDDLDDRIASYQATLDVREQRLKQKFLAMETAIATLQRQQAQLAAMNS